MGIKIDTAAIEGYAEMTAEEKLAALEGYEMPDMSGELERYQKAQSKASSEAAAWKKKYNERLSEEERAQAERDEAQAQLMKELEELKREKAVSGYTRRFMELGCESEMAGACATALSEGDLDTVFGTLKSFMDTRDKAVKAELMKGTPTPLGGGAPVEPDYAAQIREAQSRGDIVGVASLMRLMQERK